VKAKGSPHETRQPTSGTRLDREIAETIKPLDTEAVVAVLWSAGLVAEIDTRRTKRAGFKVRKFSRSEVGVLGDSLTPEQWLTAVSALEAAGLNITYRSDEGRAARVRR